MKDFSFKKDHMKGRYITTLEIRNNTKTKKHKEPIYKNTKVNFYL